MCTSARAVVIQIFRLCVGIPQTARALKLPLFACVLFPPCQDNEKRTPLHAAAYLGDAEIIELLILSGRDLSTVCTFWTVT